MGGANWNFTLSTISKHSEGFEVKNAFHVSLKECWRNKGTVESNDMHQSMGH